MKWIEVEWKALNIVEKSSDYCFIIISDALLFVCIVISTVRANQPCLGAPADGPSFVASPVSCDSYTICWNGQTIHGERCPQNMNFDAVNQLCGSSTCTDCSPFGVQNLPYPKQCGKYISCVMGTRSFRDCPQGTLFDRKIGSCNTAEHVECPDDDTITTPLPPIEENPTCFADGIFHAHPHSCKRFYICVNFNLWEQECPPGMHWNRIAEQCDDPSVAKCTIVGGDQLDWD